MPRPIGGLRLQARAPQVREGDLEVGDGVRRRCARVGPRRELEVPPELGELRCEAQKQVHVYGVIRIVV